MGSLWALAKGEAPHPKNVEDEMPLALVAVFTNISSCFLPPVMVRYVTSQAHRLVVRLSCTRANTLSATVSSQAEALDWTACPKRPLLSSKSALRPAGHSSNQLSNRQPSLGDSCVRCLTANTMQSHSDSSTTKLSKVNKDSRTSHTAVP